MRKNQRIAIAVAAVVAVAGITSIVLRHGGDATTPRQNRAQTVTPQLPDAAIVKAVQDANIRIDGLSATNVGGIVVLKGTADRPQRTGRRGRPSARLRTRGESHRAAHRRSTTTGCAARQRNAWHRRAPSTAARFTRELRQRHSPRRRHLVQRHASRSRPQRPPPPRRERSTGPVDEAVVARFLGWSGCRLVSDGNLQLVVNRLSKLSPQNST